MRRLALTLGAIALTGCNVTTSNTLGSGSTHEAGVIAADETWAAGSHVVDGPIVVSGAKLIIEAGSTLSMASTSSITVTNGGSIAVNGTSSARVVFTSAHATPGDWLGIVIDGSANNTSIIQNANIVYAGQDQGAALTVKDGGTLTLSYTRIEHSADYGLQLQGRTLLSGFQGNAFVNNALGPAAVDASSAEQLKSTAVYTPNAQEGVVVEASTLDHTATWQDLGVAYVTDDVVIATATGAATLTLNANVIIQVLPEKSWDVSTNGALVANGTPGHPVIFSSSRSNPTPGDWHEISFEKDSLGAINKLTYAIVEFGGGNPADTYGEIWLASNSQVAIDHSIIQYSANLGIDATKTDSSGMHAGLLPNFAANVLSGNGSMGVAVTADTIDGLQASSAYDGAQQGGVTYAPNGAAGVLVLAGNVAHTCTWQALGTPYVVRGPAGDTDTADLTIGQITASPVQAVTIQAGAEFRFASNVLPAVRQYGQLIVNGTAAQHVTFTADDVGWNELDVRSVNASSFSYADFSYGGIGGFNQLWVDDGVTVNLANVTFSSLSSYSSCDVGLKGTGAVNVSAGASPDTCPST